jgi:hypothetical protein
VTPAAVSPRLARALDSLRRHREAGVHFAPIRHHSPGCAAALAALLDQVHPATVLIEGPLEYRTLLPSLADPATRPPIAALSITPTGAAFYPLAEFSPEWVGLRWGAAAGAEVVFIDQPWSAQHRESDSDSDSEASNNPGTRTLQAEQHLAHSESIAALAQRLGCRDHDEVWEHLFEVRTPTALADWRSYFADVLAWAAIARLDYQRELLDADGTHAREAVMSAMIATHLNRGPVVIITGAFHTMALLEVLDGAEEGNWVSTHPAELDASDNAWLIRYDLSRLDALRGYGAGMPAPGFWQQAWRARAAGLNPREFAVEVLLNVATLLRTDRELLSASEVQAAALNALRLAELRGRSWPGRTDLLDAMLSCFTSDDTGFAGPLAAAVTTCFGGNALGQLPADTAAPPLIGQIRDQARRLRFTIDDSTKHHVQLDTARKAGHVQRREFLAKMQFLSVGFCTQTAGANLVAGTGLGLLFEEWEYAWTPLVEAALIEAGVAFPTLEATVQHRLQSSLAQANRSSSNVAALITQMLVMGMGTELPAALAQLRACYNDDPSLASIADSLHRMVLLGEDTGRLSLADYQTEISSLIESGLAAATYQVSALAGVSEDDLPQACSSVLSLHSLARKLDQSEGRSAAGLLAEMRRLRNSDTPARLHGVLVGLAAIDGEMGTEELTRVVRGQLNPGADPDQLSAFLLGLMQATPAMILHQHELLTAVNDSIEALDEAAFLQVLPDLRQAFTWLKPSETHQLANQVAQLTGVKATDVDVLMHVDSALAERGQAIEAELLRSLARDGLATWGVS